MGKTSQSTSIFSSLQKNRRMDPIEFGLTFAKAVTAESGPSDWIARNGEKSLFQVLKDIMPEVALVLLLFFPLVDQQQCQD